MSAAARVTFRTTIRLRHVSKGFAAGNGSCIAGVSALRDASLDIRGGEILIVAGPEGAGKTTLLLCAAGLLRCDAGEIGPHERHAVYIDLARAPLGRRDWPPGAAILIDSADGVGELNRARIVEGLDRALTGGAAVVIAGRDAAACLSLAPAAATVSVLHLRLGQVASHREGVGPVNRVAEGARGY